MRQTAENAAGVSASVYWKRQLTHLSSCYHQTLYKVAELAGRTAEELFGLLFTCGEVVRTSAVQFNFLTLLAPNEGTKDKHPNKRMLFES